MNRFDAAGKVQDHKVFFGEQWGEFCRWVEDCGGRLDGYQKDQTRRLRRLKDRLDKHPEAYRVTRKADGSTEAKRAPGVCVKLWRAHEAEDCRVKEQEKELRAKGWVRWAAYSLEPAYHTTYLQLPFCCIFFAPKDLVNPVNWVLGLRNPRAPDKRERMLVACARLVMAHDSIGVDVENCIYPFDGYRGKYKGKYFECDAFCQDVRKKLADMKDEGDLAKAWEELRLILEAGPADKPGAGPVSESLRHVIDDLIQHCQVCSHPESAAGARESDLAKSPAGVGAAPDGGTKNEPAPKLSVEAKAIATLYQHPEWTDKRIAKKIGCARTTLYKYPKYVQAREVLRETGKKSMPRGSKNDKTGTVEAWED